MMHFVISVAAHSAAVAFASMAASLITIQVDALQVIMTLSVQ